MALSFFAPQRTVLQMADDALYIYKAGTRGVQLVDTVPWEIDGFIQNVSTIVAKECSGKSVLILNDMVEQHYRKERVLKKGISVMDRSSMLERKIHVAFPSYPVKAPLKLKEKLSPTEDKKNPSDLYIFAAVPDSLQLNRTIEATRRSLASISAFCLLPIEATDMVKSFSDKIAKKNNQKYKWCVFIGQHKNGGLRQIVTKNGELALTRMTPVVDMDVDITTWSNEVHQEFLATMSYLTRFGYQEQDGLNVIVIADPRASEFLESKFDPNLVLNTMTVEEAAKVIGVPFMKGADDRYADLLHVTWVARKAQYILPMKASQVDKVSTPRKVATFAALGMVLGAGYLSYTAYGEYEKLSEVMEDVSDKQRRVSQLNVQLQKEMQRKESMGFDVQLVQSSIAVYDELDRLRVNPVHVMSGIGKALGRDLRFDKVSINRGPSSMSGGGFPKVLNRLSGGAAMDTLFNASMQLTFPGTSDVDKGNEEVDKLAERMRTALPDHQVTVTKKLKDYEYVDEIIVESGDIERNSVQQDFVAEIRITREIERDQDPGY